MILVVALILVERIVLIDILHIGIGLIAGIIALSLLVVVRRVALRHIDTLVSLQDAGLTVVKVAATEVVVVVVSRVSSPYTAYAILDIYLLQEVGIGRIESLLFVVQAIETHILQGT